MLFIVTKQKTTNHFPTVALCGVVTSVGDPANSHLLARFGRMKTSTNTL